MTLLKFDHAFISNVRTVRFDHELNSNLTNVSEWCIKWPVAFLAGKTRLASFI